MTIKEKLKAVRDFETQALMLSKEAIGDIVDKLSRPIEMEGVKQVNLSPKCVLVSFKTFAENSWNFSADYYISEKQTETIKEKIQKMNSLEDVFRFISKVLEDGYVILGANKNNRIALNPAIRKELEEIKEALI